MDWKRSMKGTENEVRIIGDGPLFPRLHVNDAEKRGPKAPPRNKMALYEQLSVPSQRFTTESPRMLPLSQSNDGSLVPSASSNHGHGNDRRAFTQFCNSPAPTHLAEKVHSYSFKGYQLNAAIRNFERKSIQSTNFHTSSTMVHLPSTITCNSFQPHNFSNVEKSHVEKPRDDNEYRVPLVAQLGLAQNLKNTQHIISRGRLTHPPSSLRLQTSFQRYFNEAITTDVKSRQGMMSQTEEGIRVPQTCQDSAPVLLGRNKIFARTSLSQSDREYYSEPAKRAPPSVDDSNGQHTLHQKIVTVEENVICKEHVLVERADGIIQGNAAIVAGDSCLRLSNGDDQRSLNGVKNGSEGHRDDGCGSFQVRYEDGNNDVSDTSILDSVSGLMITPDDVVEVIGKKKFWKARKAIVNQQRVFAGQVFELHRLIKIQRLISASPGLLFDGKFLKEKLFLKAHPIKKLPAEDVLEPPFTVKDDSQKPNSRTECAEIKAVDSPCLSKPESNHVPVTSVATDTNLGPWCFNPSPGNQWLVPVMSPSEGLVYKPYTGPFNSAFGVSASQSLGQTYFQHCVFPFMNRSNCGSIIEQISVNKFQPMKGSELQGSTASSPSETAKGDALALFPTTPALEVADTAQTHSCNQQTRVIKVVPHSPKLAPESAARIFQSIQEGRKKLD